MQAAKGNSIGLVEAPPECLAIHVSRDQLPRALRVADALPKAFAERGWNGAISREQTFVRVDDMPIGLRIDEGTEAYERPVKPDLNSSSYSFHYERLDVVRRPSGQLAISIQEESKLWGYSQRRNWNESAKRSIEDCLNGVLVGLIKLAAAMKAERALKERAARDEEERRRRLQDAVEEQQRLRAAVAAERLRVTALREQATLWREAQTLRGFVDEARKQGRGARSCASRP